MWCASEIECLQNTFSKLSPVNIYTNIIMQIKRSMHNIEIIQRTRQPNSCGSPRPPTCFLLLLMGEELQFHGTTTSMVDSPCLKSLRRETLATWSCLCLGPLWQLIKKHLQSFGHMTNFGFNQHFNTWIGINHHNFYKICYVQVKY